MKRPTEHIFEQIKNTLHNHEEPYREGSWERFAATNRPRRSVPATNKWKWVWVAAATTLGIVLLAQLFYSQKNTASAPTSQHAVASKNTNTTPTEITSTLPITVYPTTPTLSATAGISRKLLKQAGATTATIDNQKSDFKKIHTFPLPANESMKERQSEIANQIVATPPAVDFWKSKPELLQSAATPIVNNEEKLGIATVSIKEKQPEKTKTKKWHPSLYLSPTFGDLGIEMGYGLSLSYAINNKIKISSGIAHTKISASRSFANPTPVASDADIVMEQPQGTKSLTNSIAFAPQQNNYLQQVNGYLSGIDIPLEVSYSFNKKLYAATGVSGLLVLNDRKEYTYLNSRNERITVETEQGGLKESKLVQFNVKNTINKPVQNTADNIPFLGFYNLSVGYKQNISGKGAVSIEPFIKVPLKATSSQKLNYSSAGIRLKFDF